MNKVLIDQALFNDGVDQRIEHRDIGVGLELQRAPCVFANVGHAGVGQHNFGAALGRVFHPRGGHRMIGGGVGANDKNQTRMFNIVHLIADSSRANTL